MYNSFRKKDTVQEKIVAEYLDSKLYHREDIFDKILRTDDRENQLAGSDLLMTIERKNIFNSVVDEKAQLYYLKGGLPTFAFELSFLRYNGQRVGGWFIDQEKKTEYYMLLWLTAEEGFELIEQIKMIEFVLISRKKIFDFLSQQGLDLRALNNKSIEAINSGQKYFEKSTERPYWFVNSNHLAEKPVNIVIKKEVLKKLSSIFGTVR